MPDGMRVPSGTIRDRVHVYPVRVYYEDTDAGGIVYHASYLCYAERARTEMLRLVGVEQARLAAESGLAFAVARLGADYLAPARLDDALEVHTTLTELGAASLVARQAVRRNGRDLVVMRVRVACLGRGGRPARMPSGLRTALGRFVEPVSNAESP